MFLKRSCLLHVKAILLALSFLWIPRLVWAGDEANTQESNSFFSRQEIQMIDSILDRLPANKPEETVDLLNRLLRILERGQYLYGSDKNVEDKIIKLERTAPRQSLLLKSSYCHKRLPKELGKERVKRLSSTVWALTKDNHLQVFLKAYMVLLDGLFDAQAESELESTLASDNLARAIVARTLLGRRYDPAAIPFLIKSVSRPASPASDNSNFLDAKYLLMMEHREGVPIVRRLALSPGKKQVEAIECLAEYGNDEDHELLFNALVSGKFLEIEALSCFQSLSDALFNKGSSFTPQEKAQLLAYWESHPPTFVKTPYMTKHYIIDKEGYIRNLYHAGKDACEDEAADLMAKFIFDKDPKVVQTAMIYVGVLQAQRYLALVIPFLDSPDPAIKRTAALAVFRMRAPKGQRILAHEMRKKYGSIDGMAEYCKKWWEENSEKYPLSEKFRDRVKELPRFGASNPAGGTNPK